jgi:hypothetical protein
MVNVAIGIALSLRTCLAEINSWIPGIYQKGYHQKVASPSKSAVRVEKGQSCRWYDESRDRGRYIRLVTAFTK